MSTIKDIILNESVADVLTALLPGSSIQNIDRMYVNYKFEVIASGELLNTCQRLYAEGVFATGENGRTIKGPKWKAPAFVTSKKYAGV
ncbi:immunity protein [Pseudomonas rubra]|uniref:Immunity protein n=1 Tax=Pseudomonas rubra TaxID=2942627 RepID=A0ABT5P4L9_9PSED|nr:immunity protein [Pseudomonas rubra]MDD1013208.1 immunity protein [Pseudomonas rubra]MDD1037008.1 immunity protein [Pseudomonas rubra]MDD1154398.1 immunity protein [Pseudomonas rubra]